MPTDSYSNTAKGGFTIGFGTIVTVALVFLAGMFVGSLLKENQLLKAGTVAKTAGSGNAAAVPVDEGAAAPEDPGVNFEKVAAITKDDFVRGNEKAKVVLLEYSDFECPFCGRFHPTTNQAVSEYGDKVAVAFRHFPLSFHPNAQKAAEAAECVGKQKGDEGFWKYSDAIFEVNQKDGKLTPEAITAAATAAGANMEQFKSCLDSGEMAEKIKAQAAAGATAGVTGTPGTFVIVDGKAVDFIGGALPYEQVKTTIDKYLNS
jgi:protein-disulfide isomerase